MSNGLAVLRQKLQTAQKQVTAEQDIGAREERRQYQAQYYQKNKDRLAKKKAQYYTEWVDSDENKEKRRRYHRERYQKKKAERLQRQEADKLLEKLNLLKKGNT